MSRKELDNGLDAAGHRILATEEQKAFHEARTEKCDRLIAEVELKLEAVRRRMDIERARGLDRKWENFYLKVLRKKFDISASCCLETSLWIVQMRKLKALHEDWYFRRGPWKGLAHTQEEALEVIRRQPPIGSWVKSQVETTGVWRGQGSSKL